MNVSVTILMNVPQTVVILNQDVSILKLNATIWMIALGIVVNQLLVVFIHP